MYCIAIITLARALPTTKSPQLYQTEEIDDSYNPRPYETDSTLAFALPTNLQLPKSESAQIPFYVPDITTALKAPQYSSEPNYYQVPIPAQDLVAPSETAWNPDNDPKFFYKITQNTPTNLYPKKFDKEIHVKSKPYSSKPKQEAVFVPEKEFIAKQKNLDKVYEKLAKKENQKDLQVQQFFAQPKISHEGFTESDGHGGFGKGLSAALESASPVFHSSSGGAPHGERHEFHMAGHDGPHSYKWGFDTGKG